MHEKVAEFLNSGIFMSKSAVQALQSNLGNERISLSNILRTSQNNEKCVKRTITCFVWFDFYIIRLCTQTDKETAGVIKCSDYSYLTVLCQPSSPSLRCEAGPGPSEQSTLTMAW